MENIEFTIEHIDPLGQGVSKENNIVFIEKTLPGETGTAEIYRKAKGVMFGRLRDPKDLNTISASRIKPECSHYLECRGCQYLHTDYNTELNFKTQSLERMFNKLLPKSLKITIHPADERFKYRNRVQIHYNLETNELGLISSFSKSLINASDCLLPDIPVRDAVINLYKNNKWKELVNKSNEKQGYIEVYLKPEEKNPKISINKPYAEGGFTQVNNKMGIILKDLVTKMYDKYLDKSRKLLILDIFGGNGNLSQSFNNALIKVYDLNANNNTLPEMLNKNQSFVNIDLYKNDPVNKIKISFKSLNFSTPDLIIFDPPRAGIKFIDSYIKKLEAPFIFYISCDPATQKRDIMEIIKQYDIIEMHLIDLFPGTRHFETLIVFKKSIKDKQGKL